MVRIDISRLKTELIKLNQLLEEIEENSLHFYNTLSSVSFFWKDHYSTLFNETINHEKIDIQNTILEMKSLKQVYEYLIEQYQEIGKKIKVDFEMKMEVLLKIEKHIDLLTEIIHSYENLDLSFCYSERSYLLKEKQALKQTKEKVQNLKIAVKEMFKKMEEIEKHVSVKLNRFDIEILKETEISQLF